MSFNLKMDAAETAFFQRELEQISAENFDVRYAALKGLQFVPTDRSIDPGAETWTYRTFDQLGEAQRVTDYAKDFASVNVSGTETTAKIVSFGDSYHYSIQELRAAAKAGRPLDRMRAAAARDTLARKLDAICFNGAGESDLKGLSNLSGTCSLSTLSDSDKAWDNAKSADNILLDLDNLVGEVDSVTKGVHSVKRILLPSEAYRIIKTKARGSGTDTTVLKFFQDNNPGVEVMPWARLTDQAIAYDPDPMLVRCLLPVIFEEMAPLQQAMAYVINCHMRTGGVINPFPKSICYADGLVT